MTELGDFPVDGLQNVFRASALTFSKLQRYVRRSVVLNGFENVRAEARKHILQTVDRKVAKFCHERGIELCYLLYLAGIARLGYDREEQSTYSLHIDCKLN